MADDDAAAQYLERGLEAAPDSLRLRESAIINAMGLLDLESARENADALFETNPDAQLGIAARIVGMIASEDFAEAADLLEADPTSLPILSPALLRAWAAALEGDLSAAEARLNEADDSNEIKRLILEYQRALIVARLSGDMPRASEIMANQQSGENMALHFTDRALRAHALMIHLNGNTADAIEMLELAYSDPNNLPETVKNLRDQLANDTANAPYPWDNPRSAIAEAIAIGSDYLIGDNLDPLQARFYKALPVIIAPEADDLRMDYGQFLATNEFPFASEVLRDISPDSPYAIAANRLLARIMIVNGDIEAAADHLKPLYEEDSQAYADLLAGIYRGLENWAESEEIYSDIISRTDASDPTLTEYYYGRAVVRERQGRFDEAVADFEKALSLAPSNPEILNYYGYSLIEYNRNLDEALDMIREAISIAPNRGHIIDSLGWALYQLGQYENALEPMQRAIDLLPNDPVVNDHLGDLYWQLGREREAEYQWKRALTFEPTEEDADKIHQKLENGLPTSE